MNIKHILTLTGVFLSSHMTPAFAQDAGAPADTQSDVQSQNDTKAIAWSDPEFAKVADKITGSWKTTEPVANMGTDGQTVNLVMTITPVALAELPDAFYVETAREDDLAHPYRKSFLQLYRYKGSLRMRTLEIRDPNSNLQNLVIGMWAAPEYFPDISLDKLIGTLDLEMLGTGDAYVGQTPYPYPNATNGAVEMTSRMAISEGKIQTADTGYDKDGNVVWGAKGSALTFVPTDPPYMVEKDDLGLIVITLIDNTDTPPASKGDIITLAYTGWLTNGKMFDTSRQPGKRPLRYQLPGQLIQGWKMAVEGMSKGDWRKFIIPPDLGYGMSGAGNGLIPPQSTLIFEAQCLNVEEPTPPPADKTPINEKP